MNLSRELMQLCLETRRSVSASPATKDWQAALEFAKKQTITPLPGYAASLLPEQYRPEGETAQMMTAALQANGIKVSEMEKAGDGFLARLAAKGFRACILKGNSLAEYWPVPGCRQSGDLDVWVGGRRDDIIAALRKDYDVQNILWQECHLQIWDSVTVDVHFYPTKAANPLYRRRLMRFYDSESPKQMQGRYPTPEFNLVYCMAHIYRHALRAGVNFRQLMDYAFLLKAAAPEQRSAAYARLRSLGMGRITSDVMFAMKEVFGLDERLLLCRPSGLGGRRMVDDVLAFQAGHRRTLSARERMGMFLRYPDEVFWTPAARLSQFVWKKIKKYK